MSVPVVATGLQNVVGIEWHPPALWVQNQPERKMMLFPTELSRTFLLILGIRKINRRTSPDNNINSGEIVSNETNDVPVVSDREAGVVVVVGQACVGVGRDQAGQVHSRRVKWLIGRLMDA